MMEESEYQSALRSACQVFANGKKLLAMGGR